MTDPSALAREPEPPRARLSRRKPAALQILDLLRERIVKGEFAPGERIIERAICADMNVSRTPLREALKLLEIDGLVEISQNRGARVIPFTENEAIDLFEVLAGLEGLAAELAVDRIEPDAFADLGELHETMRGHFERGEKDPYFDLNSAIHDAVVRASQNPVLIHTHQSLTLRAKRGRYRAIVDAARWRQAFDEHEALMSAFEARDAARAGAIWRVHLTHTGDALAAVIAGHAAGA